MVSLYGCDWANNVFKVWTWGGVYRVTKEFLIGNAEVANQTINGGWAASNGVICNIIALNRTANDAANTLNDNTRRTTLNDKPSRRAYLGSGEL